MGHKYLPLTGALPGKSFENQTVAFLDALESGVESNTSALSTLTATVDTLVEAASVDITTQNKTVTGAWTFSNSCDVPTVDRADRSTAAASTAFVGMLNDELSDDLDSLGSRLTAAEGSLEAVQEELESVTSTADTAMSTAQSASEMADGAVTAAQTALETAEAASDAAESAVMKAEAAAEKAEDTKETAATAAQDAAQALALAESASSTSQTAQTTAESAEVTAQEALFSAAGKISMSGDRGPLAGYAKAVQAEETLIVSGETEDFVLLPEECSVTVQDGVSGDWWEKRCVLTGSTVTVTLGNTWTWSGGTAPNFAAGDILSFTWASTFGLAASSAQGSSSGDADIGDTDTDFVVLFENALESGEA